MAIKILYLVIAVLFYVSVVVGLNSEKVALLAHGYDLGLVFQRYDKVNDREMIEKYYDAYEASKRTMTLILRTSMLIWALTALFSIYIVSRHTFVLPFRLEVITLVVSSIVVVVFIVLPFLIFGNKGGVPPSPL